MTYRITLKTLHGDTPIIGGLALAEALEYCRQRHGVLLFECVDADLDIECRACEDVYATGLDQLFAVADGCRAIRSGALYINGPRDDDSYLLLERTP